MDLIALEVLRVFAPALYNALPDAKHILTDLPRLGCKESQKQDAAALDTMFAIIPEADRNAVRQIIQQLFPPAANLMAGSYFNGDSSDNWFPDLRIVSHQAFDRYFHFATPVGDLSQFELDEVMAVVGNRVALGARLESLGSRGLLAVLLDRLDYYKERLPIESVVPCITALLDLDVNGDDALLIAHISPRSRLKRIIYCYLRQEPDQKKRKAFLLEAMEQTTGLSTPISMAQWLSPKGTQSQSSDPDALLEDLKDIDDVRQIALAKIRDAADSERLAADSAFGQLLGFWKTWGPPGEAEAFVQKLIVSDPGVVRFLAVTRNATTTYSGPIPKVRHYYSLTSIERFVPLTVMGKRTEELDPAGMKGDDATNLALFNEALKRRKEGRGDMDFMSFD